MVAKRLQLGGGESCTSVAMEFSSPFPNQKKKFAARVVFLQEKDIYKLMRECVEDYYVYHFESSEAWDADTREKYKMKSENAVKTLFALFRRKAEFKSREATIKYLSNVSSGKNRTHGIDGRNGAFSELGLASHGGKVDGVASRVRHSAWWVENHLVEIGSLLHLVD